MVTLTIFAPERDSKAKEPILILCAQWLYVGRRTSTSTQSYPRLIADAKGKPLIFKDAKKNDKRSTT